MAKLEEKLGGRNGGGVYFFFFNTAVDLRPSSLPPPPLPLLFYTPVNEPLRAFLLWREFEALSAT